MCRTCGCGHEHAHEHEHEHAHEREGRRGRVVRIGRELREKNEGVARGNRDWAEREGVVVLNLIGAPGAGKTALLERVVAKLRDEIEVSVIEGDQATDRDARRMERVGCRAVQIMTGTGCHLDAAMMARGLAVLAPKRGSVVFVENVGNLVCPALFDLGEHAKIVVMSVTEGEDKPLKYPHVFRAADLFAMTKVDLLPHVAFEPGECASYARETARHELEIVRVSAMTGEGIDAFERWIRRQVARVARRAEAEEEAG